MNADQDGGGDEIQRATEAAGGQWFGMEPRLSEATGECARGRTPNGLGENVVRRHFL